MTAGPFVQFQGPGAPNRLLSDIGGILQTACPVSPPLPPVPAPPFEGGQCDDIRYVVTFTRSGAGEPDEQIALNSWGPVEPLTVNPVERNQDIYIFQRRNSQGGATTPVAVQDSSPNGERTAAITAVTPIGGAPDICGDPPPVDPVRPPIPQPPISPEIPTEEPDGSPGQPIQFQPRIGPIYIDADATIKVPVTVEITGPQISVDATIPVSVSLPDFNVTFEYGGTGGGSDGSPGGDGGDGEEPTPPQPFCCPPPRPRIEEGEEEDPGDPPQPEDSETDEIIGVVVNSAPTGVTPRSTELGIPEPRLYVPRIATVQFEIVVGETVAYAPDVPVKALSQYLPAPEGVEVRRAIVRYEQGWTGSLNYVIRNANLSS